MPVTGWLFSWFAGRAGLKLALRNWLTQDTGSEAGTVGPTMHPQGGWHERIRHVEPTKRLQGGGTREYGMWYLPSTFKGVARDDTASGTSQPKALYDVFSPGQQMASPAAKPPRWALGAATCVWGPHG